MIPSANQGEGDCGKSAEDNKVNECVCVCVCVYCNKNFTLWSVYIIQMLVQVVHNEAKITSGPFGWKPLVKKLHCQSFLYKMKLLPLLEGK